MSTMLLQAIGIGVLAIFADLEWFLGTCMIQRPIILGTLTGLVMGDLQTGIIMGSTLELAFAGAASIGAYDPPDMISGTILGVALAINAGGGPELALTLGIPIATVMLVATNAVGYPILQVFAHLMDRDVAKGDDKAFQRDFVLSGILAWDVMELITPIAFYFGADKVAEIVGLLPEFISDGMDIAGGLLPAMGFAMLAQMIMKRNVAPFFFVGYFAVAYFGINTTGVALFAIILLVAMFLLSGNNDDTPKETVTSAGDETKGGDFDEF